MTWMKTHVVARRNARGGRSEQEHLLNLNTGSCGDTQCPGLLTLATALDALPRCINCGASVLRYYKTSTSFGSRFA